MLQIEIPDQEFFDERTSEFVTIKGTTLRLEHSLVSVAKWETKWKKAFLDPRRKATYEESIDYVRCMTLNQNVNPDVYRGITAEQFGKINEYINSELTATTFSNIRGGNSRQVVTSELVYYWMVAYQIPFECQKWHLSRLLTLIQICNIKNDPHPKKMSKNAILKQNASLNAARRAKLHTKG